MIAEQFGTLEALYTGRIDLGLGRAPGSDGLTARALRRNLNSDPTAFVDDVLELQMYFDDASPGQLLTAVPGAGTHVPLWILGSSLFGAQVAAELGLPYAFASHFAPRMLKDALSVYRRNFKPSAKLKEPYVMLGYNVFSAETDDEAHYLASSMKQAFVALRAGTPRPLSPPVLDYDSQLGAAETDMLDEVLGCSAIGSPQLVHEKMRRFVEQTAADELIIASMIYDPEARLRSYAIARDAFS
jgi:luciferase family oxidoreductase group 1